MVCAHTLGEHLPLLVSWRVGARSKHSQASLTLTITLTLTLTEMFECGQAVQKKAYVFTLSYNSYEKEYEYEYE